MIPGRGWLIVGVGTAVLVAFGVHARADERMDCEQVRSFIAMAGGRAEAEKIAGRYGISPAYIERAKQCLKATPAAARRRD